MKRIFTSIYIGLLASQIVYADSVQVKLAPGYRPLAFKIPAAGSYDLPVIDMAADGEVLTSNNQVRHLYELMGDKITLLSFIYSTCHI